MAKATHYGTCQACGREQKLPGGVLSNHGYTVRWNMFNGTCPGSKFLPFEISKDRVEFYIKNAEEILGDWKKQIEDVIALTGTTKIPFHKYVPGRGGGYRIWVEAEVKDGEIFLEGEKSIPASRLSLYGDDKKIVEGLKEKKIAWIKRQIKGVEEYISWQNKRLAGWEPKPLKEV